ncbi:MAG: CHAD domain-containing protein [Planctomycetota bacterium]|jgi:CHAD domain-containing protein
MMSSVDQSYRLLAAKYLRKQAKRLAAQIDGARRADDPECVHQARVASRRLRAAMRMFSDCFDAKQLKGWRKQIRRVTDRLGDARDRDVQIEFLCGVLDALDEKACYPGVARLLVKLEQQREQAQAQVVRAADRLGGSGVLEEIRAVAKAVLSEAQAEEVTLQSPFALAETRRHILDNLEQLLPYQDSLADGEDLQRHHAMRIAAKRLRYTVEISAPVYGGQLDGTIDAIKRVQTLLGEVHDCDVWVEHLQTFAAKERKRIVRHYGHPGPSARLEVGIEYLRQQRVERRQQVFGELVDYWQELSRERHWERLAETVGRAVPQPAVPGPQLEVASLTEAKPETGGDKSGDGEAGQDSVGGPHSGIGQIGGPKQRAETVLRTAAREAPGRPLFGPG